MLIPTFMSRKRNFKYVARAGFEPASPGVPSYRFDPEPGIPGPYSSDQHVWPLDDRAFDNID